MTACIIVSVSLSVILSLAISLFVYQKMASIEERRLSFSSLSTNKLREITEKLDRADEEAKRYKAEVDTILDYAPFVISRFDSKTGRILYVSTAIEREMGVFQRECIGHTPTEIGLPEEMARVWEGTVSIVSRRKRALEVEFEVARSGEKKVYRTNFVPEGEDDVESVLAITRDVTRTHALLNQIRMQCDISRFYIDSVDLVMVALDPQGKVMLANRFACDLVGETPESIAGINWFYRFVPAEYREETIKFFEVLKKHKKPNSLSFKNPVISRDGTLVMVDWRSAVLTEENVVILVLSIGRPV